MRGATLAVCVVGLAVASCSAEGAREGAPEGRTTGAPTPAGGADVRVVEDPEEADLVLHVSNQSFEDDPVRITVTIDGQPVVDDSFAVEGQHSWVTFGVDLPPGDHTLVATSDTGVGTEEALTVPEGQRRWAVLDYWYYPDDDTGEGGTPRSFTFVVSAEPIRFA